MALNALRKHMGEAAKAEVAAQDAARAAAAVASQVAVDDDWDADPEPAKAEVPEVAPLRIASPAEMQRRRAERQAAMDAAKAREEREAKEKAKKKGVKELPIDIDPRADLENHVPKGLKPEDIESFRKLGVEVHLKFPGGDVWIVPQVTGRTDRLEVSIDHAKTMAMVALAFPGSHVVQVVRDDPDEL